RTCYPLAYAASIHRRDVVSLPLPPSRERGRLWTTASRLASPDGGGATWRELRGRRSPGGLRGGVREVGRRVVPGRNDGHDDLDIVADSCRCAFDDTMKAEGSQDLRDEVPVEDPVRPHHARGGAHAGRQRD